ncbi:hypothetical protein EB001_24135, partial [bacterium]|nr:hypothetical protein [bacterium]
MSKNYMLPLETDRDTDITLYGTNDLGPVVVDLGEGTDGPNIIKAIENANKNTKLTNIMEISSEERNIYNSGVINYDARYIQRSYGSIKQASMIDNEVAAKNWIYKPALLWEVTGDQRVRSINNEVGSQSTFNLAAIPLSSNLTDQPPVVVGNKLINNVIDLGEAVYWLGRHNGYFYANGEIIKFDAVQYNIPGAQKNIIREETNGKFSYVTETVGAVGTVWISTNQEYQDYMSKLAFNGKIYPTGLVRIYAEPKYEVINDITVMKNGEVARHGRGQFGTPIVAHDAGLNSNWKDNTYVRGINMQSKHLFGLTTGDILDNSAIASKGLVTNIAAGPNNARAKETIRNGIIKNFLSYSYINESENNTNRSTQAGSIQSSALVMSGPSFSTTEAPLDFLSYQYKALDNKYKHFGTRMRIIGNLEFNETREQVPVNAAAYYVLSGSKPNDQLNIRGGSGGIAVMLNPDTNVGYYFEIVALTEKNVKSYSADVDNLHNVIFYKVYADSTGKAIPVKLWGGLTNIIVDDGKFTGQARMVSEEKTTVYDLAVEYQDVGNIRRFYLY